MRKYITIGELADFLKINASTIRHYEREGLITPSIIDKNNYRLYDFDKLDRMENILLLRELDISLKDLKKLLEDYSLEKYNTLLKKSYNNLEEKLSILNEKKQAISKKLNFTSNFEITKPEFNIIKHPPRSLIKVHSSTLVTVSIKDMYDFIKLKSWFNYSKVDIGYIIFLNNNGFDYCIKEDIFPEARDLCKTIILPEGKYLTYSFFPEVSKNITNKEDIADAEDKLINESIEKFNQYIKENKLKSIGPMIHQHQTRLSHLKLYSFYITIEILIE